MKLRKTDILPILVIVIGVVQLFNPEGHIREWQKAIFTAKENQQEHENANSVAKNQINIQVGKTSISVPSTWTVSNNTVTVPNQGTADIKTAKLNPDTLEKLIARLGQKYPSVSTEKSPTSKETVIRLNENQAIIAYEGNDEIILFSLPSSMIGELVSGVHIQL